MGKLTERLDKINAKLRKDTLKADAKIEKAECAVAQSKAAAEAKVADAKKAVEDVKAEAKSRKNAAVDKIQAGIQECKEKIAAKCEAKDKKNWEEYIVALLDYAEECEIESILFEAEAILAAAMAEVELCDYIEKYGDEI